MLNLFTEAKSAVLSAEAVLDGKFKTDLTGIANVAEKAFNDAKAIVVKNYDAIVADLTTSSNAFKALRDAKNAAAADLAKTITLHTTARDEALAIASKAEATANNIDAILAPIVVKAAAVAAVIDPTVVAANVGIAAVADALKVA